MSAPEKIWTNDKTAPGDPARNGYWENRPALAWVEYTRSDLIPAMLAEARREALREASNIPRKLGGSQCKFIEDCILDLIDAEAPAQPKGDAGQDTCPRCGAAGGFGCYECTPDAGKATP